MALIERENKGNILFILGLLIFVSLISTSCGRQEAVDEPTQELPEPQEEIEQLQKALKAKEEEFTELQKRNVDLESQIPMSYEVQKGDSHWEVAYNYLTQQQGLSADETVDKLADTFLYHPIMEGFEVWNYFYDDKYGSFITQGAATVSPGTIMRLQKKEAKKEKSGLESQIENLQNKKKNLTDKLDQIQKDHEAEKNELNDEISTLKYDLNEAQSKSKNLETKLNSVYYLVGSKKELTDQNKIKGSFLGICGTRIKDVNIADFPNRIDLRETNIIALNASDLGVSQIKKVRLLPKHLEEGKDYQIEIVEDRRSAHVVLLHKDKVRLARLIICLN
jgi:hypothetical protein